MLSIKPFKIEISDAAIADLRDRLANTRWPREITDDWSRGQPTRLIKALSDRWMNDYDWRAAEQDLNRYPHFMTESSYAEIFGTWWRVLQGRRTPLALPNGMKSISGSTTCTSPCGTRKRG